MMIQLMSTCLIIFELIDHFDRKIDENWILLGNCFRFIKQFNLMGWREFVIGKMFHQFNDGGKIINK